MVRLSPNRIRKHLSFMWSQEVSALALLISALFTRLLVVA